MDSSITIEELIRLIPNIRLIDIREPYEYNRGSIKGAINIPMKYLLLNPEKYINKTNTYYVFCEMGSRSANITKKLNIKGYNTINVLGGYKEYQKKIKYLI